MRANRLRELLKEVTSSNATWDALESYISELNCELKGKILDIVESKLESKNDFSINNTLEILIPLLSDDEERIHDRSKIIAIKASQGVIDNPLNLNFLTQIAFIIDAKTSRPDHSTRVADLASLIAKSLGDPILTPSLVKKIGLLHDIGLSGNKR